MRDVNRIPEILKELEKVWIKNPDFRLGQLITVATRPSTPHPTTFYIEDDKILNGLKSFGKPNQNEEKYKPYWEKYPEICNIDVKDLSIEIIKKYVNNIKKEKINPIITPKKLMELNGAPISDENWLKGHQLRLKKLRHILAELKDQNFLEEVEIGYRIKNNCAISI